jgi:N-acetylmuramoyl-L-alanine amidase
MMFVCAACGAGTDVKPHRVVTIRSDQVRPLAARSTAGRPVNPHAFAPGSCIAFSPTSPSRHLTVFLDAGHGGRDPGAVGSTTSGRMIQEARETLPVELDTMALLRAAGFRVVVSRLRDSSVARLGAGDMSGGILTVGGSHKDVLARAHCANQARADVLVGIYFNAGVPSGAGSVTGYDAVRRFAADNLRLARLLQHDVVAAMNAQGWNIPNDGVRADAGLGSVLSAQGEAYGHLVLLGPADPGYVSTPSRMPGALIEPLFVTDPFEGSLAASRRGQRVIAGGLAKAIEQYFAPAR